jgi:hypothetical protein
MSVDEPGFEAGKNPFSPLGRRVKIPFMPRARSAQDLYMEAFRLRGAQRAALLERHVDEGGRVDADLLVMMLQLFSEHGLAEGFVDLGLDRFDAFRSNINVTATLVDALLRRGDYAKARDVLARHLGGRKTLHPAVAQREATLLAAVGPSFRVSGPAVAPARKPEGDKKAKLRGIALVDAVIELVERGKAEIRIDKPSPLAPRQV